MQLLSNNSLKYTINVTGLASTDALTVAHIHTGDVINNGGVILGLNPTFAGATSAGTILNLKTSFIDSLKNDANELYFNVHSMQVASGLVRGQLNTKIEMAADMVLSGTNEVPALITTATDIALFRLIANKKLYSKITVTALEPDHALVTFHIHKAATGVNGPIFVGVYANAAESANVKVITVDDIQFISLKADAIYVNVHSTSKPSGILRGKLEKMVSSIKEYLSEKIILSKKSHSQVAFFSSVAIQQCHVHD